MGGTALSVFSPSAGESVESVVVEAMIAEGLTRHEGGGSFLLQGWFSDDGLPYGYSLETPDFEGDSDERARLEQVAGVTMRCQVQLHIFVSDVAGRAALARGAQQVARHSEGWVFVEFARPPSAELVNDLLRAGCGVRLDHDAIYLDAAAMTAWIAHPDFHVIK